MQTSLPAYYQDSEGLTPYGAELTISLIESKTKEVKATDMHQLTTVGVVEFSSQPQLPKEKRPIDHAATVTTTIHSSSAYDRAIKPQDPDPQGHAPPSTWKSGDMYQCMTRTVVWRPLKIPVRVHHSDGHTNGYLAHLSLSQSQSQVVSFIRNPFPTFREL